MLFFLVFPPGIRRFGRLGPPPRRQRQRGLTRKAGHLSPTQLSPTRDLPRAETGGAARLVREMVERVSVDLRRRSDWPQVPEGAIDAFCESLIAADPDAAARHLSALQARGLSPDALYAGWLAAAARELGRRWDEDELGFADVTLAMTRLQRLLRELGPAFVGPGRGGAANAPLAFVTAAPGERHIFGPVMFADQLRRIGWQVRLDVSGDPAASLATAREVAPDAIGVSAGSRVVMSRLASLVTRLRGAVPGARIVLGGALVTEDPEAARRCGVDDTAASAQEFEAATASQACHAELRTAT
ncbi:MAG TPA: cobalamin B12-binding domain-containing protein [Paracoccaceae bacterium]|nr:cobalamin B12-binding domain-containing protein [Paracoccaceae bacterium]